MADNIPEELKFTGSEIPIEDVNFLDYPDISEKELTKEQVERQDIA